MSVQNGVFEVAKAAISGDRVLGLRVVAQLARTLESNGNGDQAELVRSLLNDNGGAFGLQRASTPSNRSSQKRNSYVDPSELVDLKAADMLEVEPPVLNKSVQSRIEEFILFIEKSEKLKEFDLDLSPSVLLYGPPGNGKTTTAHYIAKLLGLPLYTARCDTLISSYLGSTSKNIRSLFDYASSQPCVLFLDEFDALAKARDDQHELGELKRVVVSLLQNIDVLPSSTILIAATNHEDLLDSAVWRRFSYRLEIERPDSSTREQIITNLLSGFPVVEELANEVAVITEGMSCAVIEQVVKATMRHSILNNNQNFDVPHLIGGVFEVQRWGQPSRTGYLESVVNKLRKIDSKKFTIRKIAALLNVSSAKVSRIKSQ